MPKAASLTLRVKPETRSRLEKLAEVTQRSKSFVMEDALEQYLDLNEWQVRGIQEAVAEADSPAAEFVSHEQVLKHWEGKGAH